MVPFSIIFVGEFCVTIYSKCISRIRTTGRRTHSGSETIHPVPTFLDHPRRCNSHRGRSAHYIQYGYRLSRRQTSRHTRLACPWSRPGDRAPPLRPETPNYPSLRRNTPRTDALVPLDADRKPRQDPDTDS